MKSDDEEEREFGEEESETISLSEESGARFSGKSILFPARGGTFTDDPPAVPAARAPIDDSARKPDKSFLSFFDEPETPLEQEEESSFFTEEDDGDSEISQNAPESAAEPDEGTIEEAALSFDEFVQNEEAEAAREDLDNLIRQNDADSLFTLGQQYEQDPVPEGLGDLSDEEISITPTSILEAMLFVGNRENRPLSIDKAIALMRNVTEEDALKSVETLNRRYAETGAPYQIVQTEEGLSLTLRPELESVRERFFSKAKEVKLSQKAVDILALIAYRQPITLAEIQEIRAQSGAILNALLKRGLIETEAPNEKDGSPIYRTTPRLLKILGIQSISDLPIVDELDYR